MLEQKNPPNPKQLPPVPSILFQKDRNGHAQTNRVYTSEVGHTDFSSSENFFEDELSEQSENFLKLLVEHIDYLAQHQKYANIKKILTKKSDFINKLKETEIRSYLYLRAAKAVSELKKGMDLTAVARFMEVKSLAAFDDRITEAIQNDDSSILRDEKLFGSLDHFESDLVKSMRKLESFADRYYTWSSDAPMALRELTLLNAFRVSKIACGNAHMLFLAELSDTRNCLFGMGDNYSGQLFKNTEIKSISKPSLIIDFEGLNLQDIAANGDSSFATSNSIAFCWGKQVFEVHATDLMPSTDSTEMTRICAIREKMIIVTKRNNKKTYPSAEFYSVDMSTHNAVRIGSVQEEIRDLSCGSDHMVCLTTRGKLHGFGRNGQHQLSESQVLEFESQIRPLEYFAKTIIQSICCFAQHTTVIDSFGQVYVFGKLPNKSKVKRSCSLPRDG